MSKVIIVDDDRNFCESLALEFRDRSHECHFSTSLNELRDRGDISSFEWGVIDLRIGTGNGLDALEFIKSQNPSITLVMLTGFGSISTAVEAVKRGAKQYLAKPIQFEELLSSFEDSNFSTNEQQYPSLARKEREYIEFVLNECGGNITLAAKKLGIHRQSLQRKLKKYSPLK
ncbi:putative two-component response regulator transcriptional regulatory protein [Halobacteriovorax marinus SJ]|uniref:Two-component response regulator transcriptional regulatory protein n=1 Tax=Halobacteriovorax marinus (strain ATCC BAA-682 / DSM 15412 / SJ) TaxID=862908 RepID=E1X5B4_HALMS|nr:response regulator [Halobacteriovorax marinus]CBW25586.1 putative two-component response regulator transcriptional regulatory protein [Halobacteriovorax marinus SJ]